MTSIEDDSRCFVCGPDNPHGLKLDFDLSEEGARTRMRFPDYCQGWQGITHGGLVCTLLDEVMAKAGQAAGHDGVTAEMTVRFRKPVPTEAEVLVAGRITEIRGRLASTEAEITDGEGNVLASAKARFFIKDKNG